MTPKSAPKRSLAKQVEMFGFSLEALDVMGKALPGKRSPAEILRSFARFLHAAESKPENDWVKLAGHLLFENFGKRYFIQRARSVTFNIPGGSYTPDFNYVMSDGSYIHVEVKGSKFQKGYRDAIAKLRATATLHYEQTFVLAMPSKESQFGWSLEVIEPDKSYGSLLLELKGILQEQGESYESIPGADNS